LGLWFGYVLWFDWVRQLRPLRAEHRELTRRLEELNAVAVPSPAQTPVAPERAVPDLSPVADDARYPGSFSPEFWPIPEKAPVATVITGEVVPDKVRQAAAMLVGIPLGSDSGSGEKDG
jgi:hypothetical protein